MNQIIPLTSDPNQSFQSTLSVDGENITLSFKLHYNEMAGYWVLTIIDPATGEIKIDSIPLLPGYNILSQQSYMKIGSAYLVNASNAEAEYPTDSNLGTDFVLVWGNNV